MGAEGEEGERASAEVVSSLEQSTEKDSSCDAPKPGGPLTTRQPTEILYVSYHKTHT